MSQRFAFRVDSGTLIGSGHLMRCLTLADALAEQGGICHFVTRSHAGHLVRLIESRGYGVSGLTGSSNAYGDHSSPPAHADWLGGNWSDDAAETLAALSAFGADWLIVDHYALDAAWEKTALPPQARLAVIDDIADRPHLADVLLDQNMGRVAADYAGLVPEHCKMLIGPEFALLRPEFATLRPDALLRRKSAKIQSLLISLGGVDKDNVTGRILADLATADLPVDLTVNVVMGHAAPHLDAVKRQAKNMPFATHVLTGISNMADVMCAADLCIGAAGGSAWERCVLGLPTLMVVLADNQKPAAAAMARGGIVFNLGWHASPDLSQALQDGLNKMSDANAYGEAVDSSAALTGGDGAALMCRQLMEH